MHGRYGCIPLPPQMLFLPTKSVFLFLDSLLHPDLPVVVWLMIHTYHNPLFRPSAALLSFVLHIGNVSPISLYILHIHNNNWK